MPRKLFTGNLLRARALLSVLFSLLLAAGVGAVSGHAGQSQAFSLDSVRAKVTRDYNEVSQLAADQLEALLVSGPAPMLVDVREAGEYAVSHIGSAVQVDPGISSARFLESFAAKSRGRPVVFYCSVGVRSSILAGKVQAALKVAGAGPVYNLDGGIFGWHNERRVLMDAAGPTDFVHPYDSYWGKLLTRRDLARLAPGR